MKTTVYIIRHGHTESNLAKTFTGQLESPLSDIGRAQAERIAARLADAKLDALYSSDLSRAVDTLRPLADARGLDIVPLREMREIYAGIWEGMTFSDVEVKYADTYRAWKQDMGNATCTDGESVAELGTRVIAAIGRIVEQNKGKSVAVATHATPVRAYESYITYGSLEGMKELEWVPNGAILKVTFEDSAPISRELITDHLSGLDTRLPDNI